MELLRDGLRPFVEREMQSRLEESWEMQLEATLSDTRLKAAKRDKLRTSRCSSC